MKIWQYALPIICFSLNTKATLLKTEGPATSTENIKIYQTATVQFEDENLKLTSLSSGIRNKKIAFFNVKVYLGQLFTTGTNVLTKNETESLKAIHAQKAIAIQLHFLRDVDSKSIEKSFVEALQKNNVDLTQSPLDKFITAIKSGGDIKKGQTITILGTRGKDNSEIITYETAEKPIIELKGANGLREKVFSIWLGTPVDDGVGDLKKSLLRL